VLTSIRRRLTLKAIRGLLRLNRWLGPSGAQRAGRVVGGLAGWVGPLRRRLADNLRCAGIAPTEDVLDRYFDHFGTLVGWSLAVYQNSFEQSGLAGRFLFDESIRHLDDAVARGKGVVLASPHLFCHELAAAAINRRHPIMAIVRESKDAVRGEIKQHWYRATGIDTVFRARHSSLLADTFNYIRILREGKVLAITPDILVEPSQGVPVSMFGRTVHLSPGIVQLAMRSGAALVTCLGDWHGVAGGGWRVAGEEAAYSHGPRSTVHGPRIVMSFGEPIVFPRSRNRDQTLRHGMQSWVSTIENYLRDHPANWLFWLDKRWTRQLRKKRVA
jgi:lauroyl/myristoyl acyltransferase